MDVSRVAALAMLSSTSHYHRLVLLQANAELEYGKLSVARLMLNGCVYDDDRGTIIVLATLGLLSFDREGL